MEPDLINHPPHYTQGKIEVLDFILDQRLPYLEGQIVKYLSRHRFKGASLQDLRKAQFYLNRLIQEGEHGNAAVSGNSSDLG